MNFHLLDYPFYVFDSEDEALNFILKRLMFKDHDTSKKGHSIKWNYWIIKYMKSERQVVEMSWTNCIQVDLFLSAFLHASENMSFCWDEGHLLCSYWPNKTRKTGIVIIRLHVVLVTNCIQDFDKHAKEHFTDLGKLNFPMGFGFRPMLIFNTAPVASKNDAWLKSVQNWLKNKQLAALI